MSIKAFEPLPRTSAFDWLPHSYTSDGPSSLASASGAKEPLLDFVAEKLTLAGEGVVLVEGAPGTGKTKFALCLLEVLFGRDIDSTYLDVRKLLKENARQLEKVAKERKIDAKDSKSQRKNVLILDGIDVLFTTEDTHLRQLYLPDGGVKLLLARQANPEVINTCSHKINLGGFVNYDTAETFISHQLAAVYKITRPQVLLSYIRIHPLVRDLCCSPLMVEILTKLYANDNKCIKETETLLLHRLVVGWVKKIMLQLQDVKSLYVLPAEEKEHLLHIACIAFHGLLSRTSERGGKEFSLSASDISFFNLQAGYPSLDKVQDFGLIQCNGNTVHRFLHLTIQEFLAALHLSCQPQNEQISFYYEVFPKHMMTFQNVCLFHFGLTRLETEEFLNPSRIIISGMIESLAHVTQKQTGSLRLQLQQLIQACLHEAQDPILVRNFCQQYTDMMKMTFPNTRVLDDARWTSQVTYVILQSGINSWEILIPNENAHGKTDTLVFPISMVNSKIKIAVKVELSLSPCFAMKAIFEAKATKRTGRATEMLKRAKTEEEKEMYFQLAMVVTGQRETLHRVTQLYSPVPVRSDAADPAYASLITCGCVENVFKEEVHFEPIHPIHTVPISPTSKKIRGGDRDETTLQHMKLNHEGNFLEVIVLNKPCVRSITFQPPGGLQQCRLVLSSEKTSSSMSGRIAMEAENSIADQENCVACMTVTELEPSITKCEMIAHGLPLPKSKAKIETEKANNALQISGTAGTRVHGRNDAPNPPINVAQRSPSLKNYQESELRLYSPVLAQAESTEKVTWRPGMIMFTTLPDVFQKHKTYSLPVEDNQLRKGGNGTIFATDYMGYSLVAKKTLFRSREYNIVQRLKHPNIISLLALMVGEVSHRRRFFCYHMLPKMSSDAARMLSDHSEFTLSTLKHTYSDNPMQFGLALGNMRYLLAEVLKGLSYMHGLHIIHRDIKASNILVRFHCQHENLLWCTCFHKYTVCVCDFDAALELSEQNEMLPISPTNQVYYLPPVGTQGFRSPEGSQLILASHEDVMSPKLSPRTDIWSFGVLMLRLFVGEDGPSSQRHNAILLLKYHEMMSKPERRKNDKQWRLSVLDHEVDRIVKLPILRAKLSGVNHLVNFVSRCLRIDPQQRPSANDLLQDPFLF